MGRSVSYASGAFAVAYEDISGFGYQREDEEGKAIPFDKQEYCEVQVVLDWDCWLEDIKESMKAQYPSFVECDKWVGREDHAILQNDFAYFGVSEYCGLASLWLVFRSDLNEYKDVQGIAERWARQITPGFFKHFGSLHKIGTFSNGEAVYRKNA